MNKLNDEWREKYTCGKTENSIEIDCKRTDKSIGKARKHDTNE